jgi:acyl-CoA synthetase (AMP-forming)/AMP-acid ligase II
VIVPKPGQTPAIADILAFARTHLADFKVPQYIVLRTAALPRNPGGKVIKKQIRQDTEWGKQVW